MKRTKILIIDDDPPIRRALKVGLEKANYQVLIAAGASEGLDVAALESPDLVILDIVLSGVDGFEVCRQLREWLRVPIIVVSGRDSESDRIKILDLGADDFLSKPFSMGELQARIRAALRRTCSCEEQVDAIFSCADLTIDFPKRIVSIGGKEVHVTPTEYDLLRYLATNSDRVLTHRQIISNVWGEQFCDDHHTLRVYINNLRNKIERQRNSPRFIQTETGVGYRFQTLVPV